MAEVTQYKFELAEVVEALLVQQGITTGKWMLGVEFGLGAGVTGPTQLEARPSAITQVKSLVLVVATPEAIESLPHLVVDAAEIAGKSKRSK